MDILQGISGEQLKMIRSMKTYFNLNKGDVVINEGSYSFGFYIVLEGEVEVLREGFDGERIIATLGPNEIFGEIGAIMPVERTATVRASKDSTVVLGLPGNIVDSNMLKEEPRGVAKLLENILGVLVERLRLQNAQEIPNPRSRVVFESEMLEKSYEDALQKFEDAMPKGILGLFGGKKLLMKDECLFTAGARADGFYFIHEGMLDVLGPNDELITRVAGPTVTGESAFFLGQKRGATLKAAGKVVYSFFPGKEFERMRKKDPIEAAELLMAACRIVIYMMLTT